MLPENKQDRCVSVHCCHFMGAKCLHTHSCTARHSGQDADIYVLADVLRALHNAVEFYTEAGRLGMAAKQLRVCCHGSRKKR